jgi:O-antigen/teichoic acid export membrane protein
MTAITNAALGWIRSRDQLWMFGLVSVLASVGAGALSLALVVVVRRTAAEYVLGQLLAQAAAVLVALIAVRPLLIRLADLRLVRGALRYAGALVPAALAAFAMGAAARLIIQHDLGATAVARYAIAFNIGSVPMLLLNVLDISWMPRIFALPTGRIRRAVLSKSRDGVYTLLIPVVIGLSAGAPIVLAAWAPPDYHPDGLLIVVALLAGSALPLAGTMASTRVLLLTNRTVHVGTLTVIAATLAVALTVVLVPRLGLDGAALATFVGYSAQHVLLGLAARAVEPIARPRASLLAKCAVAGLAAALFTQLPIDAALTVIRALVAAVSLVVFAAVLCELVVPGRYPTASRLARRMHVIRSSA